VVIDVVRLERSRRILWWAKVRRFFGFIFWLGLERGIPQGLKPFFVWEERPKAKALGYLDATTKAIAKATADSFAALRNDNQKDK
jgi:hypothetical protein